jgi:hypothetical protein
MFPHRLEVWGQWRKLFSARGKGLKMHPGPGLPQVVNIKAPVYSYFELICSILDDPTYVRANPSLKVMRSPFLSLILR